jgi:predicted enzyme related to lactoylglutathione lyase
MANPVLQFRILSKAPDATASFYSAVFGWKVDAGNPLGYRRIAPDALRAVAPSGALSQARSPVRVYLRW